MHDSFNPQCRAGMQAVDFKAYPSVEYVELDYITGSHSPNANFWEMWGGLGMIQINPTYAGPSVAVLESQGKIFQIGRLFSKHLIKDPLRFLIPLKRKLYGLLGKKHLLDMYDSFDQ